MVLDFTLFFFLLFLVCPPGEEERIPGLVTWMSWMMNYVGTLLWRAYNSKVFRGVVEDREEVYCERVRSRVYIQVYSSFFLNNHTSLFLKNTYKGIYKV